MSIETETYDGPAVLECDGCGTFLEFSSFKKAVLFKKKQRQKQHGWRSVKKGESWEDFCGECVRSFAMKNR